MTLRPPPPAAAARLSIRGMRYGEILLTYSMDTGFRTEVWGTQGVNLCPAAEWDAIDPAAVLAETGAAGIKLNGPRHLIADFSRGMQLPEVGRRTYGNLEMRLLATVEVDLSSAARRGPYTPIAVARSNVWEFHAGCEIYALTGADGTVYVMQAYSLIVDPTLRESDLASLGERLALPDGWSFAARVLDQDLEVPAKDGVATVLQDELENTYQRLETLG